MMEPVSQPPPHTKLTAYECSMSSMHEAMKTMDGPPPILASGLRLYTFVFVNVFHQEMLTFDFHISGSHIGHFCQTNSQN